jgi:hypothetical protein
LFKPKRSLNVNAQSQSAMQDTVNVSLMDNFAEHSAIVPNAKMNSQDKICRTSDKIKDANAPNQGAKKTIVSVFRRGSLAAKNAAA